MMKNEVAARTAFVAVFVSVCKHSLCLLIVVLTNYLYRREIMYIITTACNLID